MQPESYQPTHDFGNELGSGHGANLDQEFENIAQASEQTNTALARIQRDDGRLANRSVHGDSLDDDVLALFGNWTPRGAWAAATSYATRDLVTESGVTYVCVTSHTSQLAFADDLALVRWLAMTSDVAPASDIAVTPAGGISSSNVQDALEELDSEKATVASLAAHLADTDAAHAASAISVSPAGRITSTSAQAALQELDALMQAVSYVSIAGDTSLTNAAVRKRHVISATSNTTLPAANTVSDGDIIYFKSTTQGNAKISPNGADTIDGVNTFYRLPSFCSCAVMRIGATAWVLVERPAHNIGDWMWSGQGTANQGWVKAGSGNQSRSTLAALFDVYGTTWGAGDGATTFGIPDARGRAPIQAGSGSISESVAHTAITTGTDEIAVASNDSKWITGMQVTWTVSGTPPTTNPANLLDNNDVVFVIRISATAIKLATTLANAQNGTPIDITAQGNGTFTMTNALTARTLGQSGGEESHAQNINEILAHTHAAASGSFVQNAGAAVYAATGAAGSTAAATASRGGNQAANNMSPFIVGELYIKT